MRNKEREASAKKTADFVKKSVAISSRYPKTAVILGTGWGDVLMESFVVSRSFRLINLPGFSALKNMEEIPGHRRELILGVLQNCKSVAMLRGRIHLNESHNEDELQRMVRLQVEMLLQLGVKHLILTNAAGSLRPEIGIGDVVAHDSFVTDFAPPLPLWGGEFVSAEDTLNITNVNKILDAAYKAGLRCHAGGGAMKRGPDFEGRKHDKRNMRQAGASMAMMSILPEAAVAALYPEVNVYAISFITNTDSEEHSHEENQRRAKESSGKLGCMLLNLIGLL